MTGLPDSSAIAFAKRIASGLFGSSLPLTSKLLVCMGYAQSMPGSICASIRGIQVSSAICKHSVNVINQRQHASIRGYLNPFAFLINLGPLDRPSDCSLCHCVFPFSLALKTSDSEPRKIRCVLPSKFCWLFVKGSEDAALFPLGLRPSNGCPCLLWPAGLRGTISSLNLTDSFPPGEFIWRLVLLTYRTACQMPERMCTGGAKVSATDVA